MGTPTEEIILRKDGDKWMCVTADFKNLQESGSHWGDTPEDALDAFLQSKKTFCASLRCNNEVSVPKLTNLCNICLLFQF